MKTSRWIAVAAACLLAMRLAHAHGFPDKPLRLIVPFGAGGINDYVARMVGQGLSKELGQPVLVENRPGAGGVVAAQVAARAMRDGYTLFLGTVGTQIVNPLILPKGSLPYAPDTQFAPLGMVSKSPYVLAVSTNLPVTTFESFLAYAKKHPGELNFGSAGYASAPYLGMELLNYLAGLKITHIPYKSGAEAINAAIGGQVSVVLDALPVLGPHIASGKLRALVLASSARSPVQPQLRTNQEAGLPTFESNSWSALYVPSGTPTAAITRLSEALRAVLGQAELRQRMAAQGTELFTGGTQEYDAFMQEERKKWIRVVAAANIRSE
ncbi:Bug family tripartite tricarboxylate transporter substrate binding protein [Cupriavidus sp. 2TAF22]|uniref:Bug family tripartite tricarboxylate transporter substrate binding protein n=1 Tax=unclassified Cupriavidus TaxID=2640874 RepID=UPI003F920C3E